MERLTTDWLLASTSGYTGDDRKIDAQTLRDVNENYDSARRAAKVWPSHWHFGSPLGKIVETRLVDHPAGLEGEVALEVRIEVGAGYMLDMVRRGNLHFSVEIRPDYSNTGKPYLVGLAIVPEPACDWVPEITLSDSGQVLAYGMKGDYEVYVKTESVNFSYGETMSQPAPKPTTKPAPKPAPENTTALSLEDVDAHLKEALPGMLKQALSDHFGDNTPPAPKPAPVADPAPPQPASPDDKFAQLNQTISDKFSGLATLTEKFEAFSKKHEELAGEVAALKSGEQPLPPNTDFQLNGETAPKPKTLDEELAAAIPADSYALDL